MFKNKKRQRENESTVETIVDVKPRKKKLKIPLKEGEEFLAKIYKIECIDKNIEARKYIGSTSDTLLRRMNQHRKDARAKLSNKFHQRMNEVGEEKFIITLVEELKCKSDEEMVKREFEEIDKYSKDELLNTEIIFGKICEETILKRKRTVSLRTNNERNIIAKNHFNAKTAVGCVSWEQKYYRWKFIWYNEKKQKSRSFSESKFGTKEKAHEEVLKFQKEIYPNIAEKLIIKESKVEENKKGVFKLYKIYNTINKKIYIGLTNKRLVARLCDHRCNARVRSNSQYLNPFHQAMIDLGLFNFQIELIRIIDKDSTKDELLDAEANEIKKYPSHMIYNEIIDRKFSSILKGKCSIKQQKGGSISFNESWNFSFKSSSEGIKDVKCFHVTSKINSDICRQLALEYKESKYPYDETTCDKYRGNIYHSTNWKSHCYVNGKKITKSFSENKYGKEQAKELAIKFIEKKFPQLKNILDEYHFSKRVIYLIQLYLY